MYLDLAEIGESHFFDHLFANQVYVLVWIMKLSLFSNSLSTWEWMKTELGANFLNKTNKPAIDHLNSRILFLCLKST